jgi:hypothetical protein
MRVLVSIGCDAYENADTLAQAERDARRVFDTLIRPEVGDYDPHRSRLVLSPSLEELKAALLEALFGSAEHIETLTFYFAGHGTVHAGSFYMWVRNSRHEAQSMTAFSLGDLFRMVKELAPSQTNIVIDACESGGLVKDLGDLLNADRLGEVRTPGISLLASAAMNQSASETDAGGVATNAILDCIQGREFVQDTTPTLDLLEIARRIRETRNWAGQNPVAWGINLLDIPRFCRNPCYASGSDHAKPFNDVLRSLPAITMNVDAEHYEKLWRTYAGTSEAKWSARQFVAELQQSLAHQSPEAFAEILLRLDRAVTERARLSPDRFRPAQVKACLATSLLPYLGEEQVDAAAITLLAETASEIAVAGEVLIDDLDGDQYALLRGSPGGLADFYHLPLRVSNVLAWLAAGRWTCAGNTTLQERTAELFSRGLEQLTRLYPGCIVAMSDAQAAPLSILLGACLLEGKVEAAEEVSARMFCSLVEHKGRIARSDLAYERELPYLLARQAGELENVADLVERPVETLTVLLLAAGRLKLNDVWDPSLWKLDGLPFSAFISDDYREFAKAVMCNGRNHMWTIGFDVFTVDDFVKGWPGADPSPNSPTEAGIAVLAALLFPDRVPWFCLSEMATPASELTAHTSEGLGA